jgi:hypothetical protein
MTLWGRIECKSEGGATNRSIMCARLPTSQLCSRIANILGFHVPRGLKRIARWILDFILIRGAASSRITSARVQLWPLSCCCQPIGCGDRAAKSGEDPPFAKVSLMEVTRRKWQPAGSRAGGMQFVLISTELGVTPWAAIKICINKFCPPV